MKLFDDFILKDLCDLLKEDEVYSIINNREEFFKRLYKSTPSNLRKSIIEDFLLNYPASSEDSEWAEDQMFILFELRKVLRKDNE